MIDRKKLKQDYKNTIPEKGVFAIRNTKNGKVFLASTLNLYNVFERNKVRLNFGSHFNERFQEDWKTYGEEAFTFEVLGKLKLSTDMEYNYDEDLKILELMCIEKFQPFSEECYNKNENIRMV